MREIVRNTNEKTHRIFETMLNRNNDFDCSKAKRELGFCCRPFSESIRDTVEWLGKEIYGSVENETLLTIFFD